MNQRWRTAGVLAGTIGAASSAAALAAGEPAWMLTSLVMGVVGAVVAAAAPHVVASPRPHAPSAAIAGRTSRSRPLDDLAPDVDLTLGRPTGSIRDPETGLLNGAYFRAALTERLASASRTLHPVTVAVLLVRPEGDPAGDVDDDELLAAAAAMRATLRDADTVCRLDGRHFGVVLSDTPDTASVWALERIRRGVALKAPVTVRAGVASYPTHGLAADDILLHAEDALGLACTSGHDGIQVASSD